MENKIKKFVEIIEKSNNIVFFGGAGVSTESGIPDFRSTDGLYNQPYKFPPEIILSRSFFTRETEEFYRFYWHKMIHDDAQPSVTHLALAKLEKEGKLKAVITQNIDGLHQLAGSENVIELHGTVHNNHCVSCKKEYKLGDIKGCDGVPKCECGGIIKPNIVLYEEGLEESNITKAIDYITKAEVMIVGGTSLGVYPAAGLVNYYKGDKLILVNKSETPFDKKADLLINESLGRVFGAL